LRNRVEATFSNASPLELVNMNVQTHAHSAMGFQA